MGQYYRGVILGKTTKKAKKIIVRQAFCCYAHNNGAKLMEHSYVGNWYVKEYETALANGFYGHPFVWAGDYADERYDTDAYSKACEFIEKEAESHAKLLGYKKTSNGMWGEEYKNKKGETRSEKELCIQTPYEKLESYEYVVNLTKRLFVRIPKKQDEKWIVHPLPLLCADGNGRGGGDYKGTNMDLIGSWAYDRIGVSNTLPKGFTRELQVKFVQSYEGGDSSVNDYKIVKHKKGV